MNTTVSTTIGCILIWGAMSLVVSGLSLEIGLGMIAPLVVAVVSMQQIEQIHAGSPGNVTRYLLKAFAVKMVLFGVYVGLVIGILTVQPIPFIASFVSFFIGLHGIEALQLHGLSSATATNQSS